jgi:hypothetical protein
LLQNLVDVIGLLEKLEILSNGLSLVVHLLFKVIGIGSGESCELGF